MDVEILVLTSDNCVPCKALTKEMKDRGILFREIGPDHDKSIEYRDAYGLMGSPITIIKSEYDIKFIHGNGKKTMEKILAIARKHKLYVN